MGGGGVVSMLLFHSFHAFLEDSVSHLSTMTIIQFGGRVHCVALILVIHPCSLLCLLVPCQTWKSAALTDYHSDFPEQLASCLHLSIDQSMSQMDLRQGQFTSINQSVNESNGSKTGTVQCEGRDGEISIQEAAACIPSESGGVKKSSVMAGSDVRKEKEARKYNTAYRRWWLVIVVL